MLIILRDVVMKVLKANNYVPKSLTDCEVVNFPVKDIIITAPRKWIAKKMKPFTESIESVGMMWPVILVHLDNYWEPMKSKRWPRKNLEGDFVEFGTGKGFTMTCVLESLEKWNESEKKLWLFDTFKPAPPSK